MKTFSEYICEGVVYDAKTNSFIFDFDNDGDKDIVAMQKPVYSKSGSAVDVYHFSYMPEPTGKNYNEFLKFIKSPNAFDNKDIEHFVNIGIRKFIQDDNININEFGAILFPQSRSIINQKIVDALAHQLNVEVNTFEFIKNLPKNVKFNYKMFERIYLNRLDKYGRKMFNDDQKSKIVKSIEENFAKAISGDYFSIASALKTKYQKFIYDFLIFKNEEQRQDFIALERKPILIIDDVVTSGSTVNEICRIARANGITSKIVVFSLIGSYKV